MVELQIKGKEFDSAYNNFDRDEEKKPVSVGLVRAGYSLNSSQVIQ